MVPDKQIKVFHLDDEASYTGIVKTVLSSLGDQFHLVGTANKVNDCYTYFERHRDQGADIVLVDLEMPKGGGGDGFEVTKQLRKINPSLKIVLLTTHNVWDLANAAIKNGANGFLLKESSVAELAGYLLEINEGGLVIDRRIKDNEWPYVISTFTEDETEVIRMLMEEKSNAQMAELMSNDKRKMYVSAVDSLRISIASKLKCEGSYGIAKYALKNGLFPLERGVTQSPSTQNQGNFEYSLVAEQIYKVFIVDNHRVFSNGLEICLKNNSNKVPIEILAYPRDENECMKRLDETSHDLPDLLIINCNLSNEKISMMIKSITGMYPGIKIVAILPNPNIPSEQGLIQAGAHSVLDRSMDIQNLLNELLSILVNNEKKRAIPQIEQSELEPFELAILRGILEEKNSRTIATELYTDELLNYRGEERRKHIDKLAGRIDTKRYNMLRKTGSINTIGLIKYAWKTYLF